MGMIHAEITLKNAIDVANARSGLIKEQDVRQIAVQALVDTGAWTLIINEEIREKLGVEATRTEMGALPDGTQVMYKLAGPLEVRWKDRVTDCDAMVLPGAEDVLLGIIPLEAMDLTVNLSTGELTGAHGNQIMHAIK